RWPRDWSSDVCSSDLGREMLTLPALPGGVRSMAFSPEGRYLATGGGDGAIKVWDVITGLETVSYRGHAQAVSSLAFSPNGKRLEIGRASCRERGEAAA